MRPMALTAFSLCATLLCSTQLVQAQAATPSAIKSPAPAISTPPAKRPLAKSSTQDIAIDVQKELNYRVEFGSASDVKYLLEKGGNPNARNKNGAPLVSVAAARSDGQSVPILKALAEGGADLNNGGRNNLFPIILAARNGDPAIMEYLLEQNIDVDVKDRNGVGPDEIARFEGHQEVLALIEDLVFKREETEAERRSMENYNKHLRGLLVNRCGNEYTYYYYNSKMGIKPENYNAIMQEWGSKVQENSRELAGTFKVEPEAILGMQNYASTHILEELNSLISNRYRRKKGVGSPGDLEKRCNKIADQWIAQSEKEQAKEDAKEKRKKRRSKRY